MDLLMKKNLSFWIALALPVIMILFVAGSVYLPRLWAPIPQYGFLYTGGEGIDVSSAGYRYLPQVIDGRLVRQDTGCEKQLENQPRTAMGSELSCIDPILYHYDPVTRESRNITFEEAQGLRLDDRQQSADGFSVKQGGSGGGSLFGIGSYSGANLYLTGHATSIRLELHGVQNAYEFRFIGWVEK